MCHNNSQLLSHIIDNSKYVRGYMISFRDNKVWLISHSVWLSPEKKMIEVTDYNSGLLNCNDTAFIPLYILERNEDCVTPNLKFNKVNLQISKTIELNFYQEGLFSKQKLTEILKQPQYTPLKVEEQVVVIFSGVNGFLDKINISEITRFEDFLLKKLRNQGKDILKTIKDQKSLSEETEKKLNQFLESITNEFLQ